MPLSKFLDNSFHMPRTFIKALFVAILLHICINIQAQTEKSYVGPVSGISMNDKHFADLQNKTFVLKKQNATTGIIYGIIDKIGKMPGSLHFEIPVKINTDGNLSASKGEEAGEMTMPMGLSKSLIIENFNGELLNGKLHFVLHISSSMLGIKVADATMTFDGK